MLNSLLSSYAIDKIEPYAKWITIGLIAISIIALIVLFFAKREAFGVTAKYFGIIAVIYAFSLGILLLSLELAKKYSTGYLDDKWVNREVVKLVFVPLLTTLIVGLCSVVTIFILKKKKFTNTGLVSIILGGICLVLIVVTLITMAIYHNKHIVGDGYYDGYGKLNGAVLYVCAGVLVLLVVAFAMFFGRNTGGFDTKTISFAGITIALSFVLSYIKLWEMPQGGSITLVSMLPIMIFAYVHGTKKGVFVGTVYGLLQAIQDPWLIHPAQFILDYPIAFAMVGFCGLFSKVKVLEKLPQLKFTLGAIVCGLLRFVSHVLSGVFAFGAYAVDQGKNLWTYSLAYNSFVFVDIALVIVAGILVFSSKAFQKAIEERES